MVLRDVFGRIHASAHLPGLRDAVAAVATRRGARARSPSTRRPSPARRPVSRTSASPCRSAVRRGAEPAARAPAGSTRSRPSSRRSHARRSSRRAARRSRTRRRPGLPDTLRFREPTRATPAAPLPDFWPGDERPLAYVTFGSVAPDAAVLRALIDGVLERACSGSVRGCCFTVGDATDLASLAAPPAQRARRALGPAGGRRSRTRRRCVSHGGFGSTLGAVCAGVPMVVIPLFADQPANAPRVAALGAGVVLEGGPALAAGSPPEIVAAVRRLLSDAPSRGGRASWPPRPARCRRSTKRSGARGDRAAALGRGAARAPARAARAGRRRCAPSRPR